VSTFAATSTFSSSKGGVVPAAPCLHFLLHNRGSSFLLLHNLFAALARANIFEKDVEELVNDLKNTAAGVHTMLLTMTRQTDEVLARTEKALQAQEALREQQAATRAAAERVDSHLGQLQGSLESFGHRQESLGMEVLDSLGRLGQGAKEVRENVLESLLRQEQMAASQEAAGAALEKLQSGQTQLVVQQTRDHQRLEHLAEEHHRRTAAWQDRGAGRPGQDPGRAGEGGGGRCGAPGSSTQQPSKA